MYKPSIFVILDSRRANKEKLYPLKLRATFTLTEKRKKKWKQVYYSLNLYSNENDFKAARTGKCRSLEQTDLRAKILDAESKAQKILDAHTIVTEELFKRLYGMDSLETVGSVFNLVMDEMLTSGRIGNYSLYKTARNSIARFVDPNLVKMKTRKKEDTIQVNISFQEINKEWLKRYVTWLQQQVSATTIAIYLTHLKAVFNKAMELYLVKPDMYPFGRRGFKIKRTSARKIALNEVDKNRVLSLPVPELKLFIDFWAFSFFCYGLNMMDIAFLKVKDLKDDLLIINRAKTDQKLIIPLRLEAKEIIARRGNKTLNPRDYVFPILSPDLSPTQVKNRVNDFIGKINKGLKLVEAKLELPVRFTFYTARHTFANVALHKGASKEFIQEALGHKSILTTENYTAGFDVKTKKAMGSAIYD